MKNVFVALPIGLTNSLEIAQAFVHAVECELDTYCQLIPYHNVPLSFWTQQNIQPLDYLRQCLAYMKGADVIVFTYDWEEHRECALLHDIAVAYGLNIHVIQKPVEVDLELKPCPFCGESEKLSLLEHEKTQQFAVKCDRCFAIGSMADSRDVAVLAWNSRPNAEREKDA